MALRFGFGLYDKDPAAKKIWEKKFQALSHKDKEFSSDTLVAVLLVTSMEIVTKRTIPHILSRLEVIRPDWLTEIYQRSGEKSPSEYLKKFTGFRVNIRTLPHQDFIKKVKARILPLGKWEVSMIHMMSGDLCLLDEASMDDLPLFINRQWASQTAHNEYQKLLEKGKT